jgi:hypothetical protein
VPQKSARGGAGGTAIGGTVEREHIDPEHGREGRSEVGNAASSIEKPASKTFKCSKYADRD